MMLCENLRHSTRLALDRPRDGARLTRLFDRGSAGSGVAADSVEPSPFDEELEQPAATIAMINAPAPTMVLRLRAITGDPPSSPWPLRVFPPGPCLWRLRVPPRAPCPSPLRACLSVPCPFHARRVPREWPRPDHGLAGPHRGVFARTLRSCRSVHVRESLCFRFRTTR